MAIGDTITSPLPTVGGSVDTWGSVLNTFLTEIKNTVEAKVTTGGLDINAALDLNKNVLLDTGAIAFSDQAAVLTGAGDARKLYTKSGELYFTDSGLTAVQITSGGALNAAALQGITGAGYGSSGVELTWVSGSSEYRFKSGSDPDSFAFAVADEFWIRDGSGNQIKMAAAASMSSDYTITWPNAAPASGTRLIGISNTGTVSYGPTFTSGTFTDLTVTNPIKHGSYTLHLGTPLGLAPSSGWTAALSYWLSLGNSASLGFAVPVIVGDRITSLSFYLNQATSTGITVQLYYATQPGLTSPVVVTSTTSDASTGLKTVTLSSINHTIVAGRQYYLTVQSATNGDHSYGCQVNYDRP